MPELDSGAIPMRKVMVRTCPLGLTKHQREGLRFRVGAKASFKANAAPLFFATGLNASTDLTAAAK